MQEKRNTAEENDMGFGKGKKQKFDTRPKEHRKDREVIVSSDGPVLIREHYRNQEGLVSRVKRHVRGRPTRKFDSTAKKAEKTEKDLRDVIDETVSDAEQSTRRETAADERVESDAQYAVWDAMRRTRRSEET